MITDKAVSAVVNDAQKWDPECSPPWFPEGGAHAAVRHMLEIAEPHMSLTAQTVAVDRAALVALVKEFGQEPDDDTNGWVFFADKPEDIADAFLRLLGKPEGDA